MEWTAHEFHWWNAPARLEGPDSLATARHSCPPQRSWNRKIGFDFILGCGWLWSFPIWVAPGGLHRSMRLGSTWVKKVCTNSCFVFCLHQLPGAGTKSSCGSGQRFVCPASYRKPRDQGLGVSSRQVVVRIRPSLESDDSRSELLSSGNGFVRLNAEDAWEAGKSHRRDSLVLFGKKEDVDFHKESCRKRRSNSFLGLSTQIYQVQDICWQLDYWYSMFPDFSALSTHVLRVSAGQHCRSRLSENS